MYIHTVFNRRMSKAVYTGIALSIYKINKKSSAAPPLRRYHPINILYYSVNIVDISQQVQTQRNDTSQENDCATL